jgi:apoptosis-inducing factor 2
MTSLTLVTARPIALHLPVAIRMTTTTEGKLEGDALIPYDHPHVNNNGAVHICRVTSIEKSDRSAVLSTDEWIQYDILVLAPESEYEGFPAFPDAPMIVLLSLNTSALISEVRECQRGNLGSGSAPGCPTFCWLLHLFLWFDMDLEYAGEGEMEDASSHMKVIIAHSDSRLLNSAYPDKYRERGREENHFPRHQYRLQ